MEKLLPKYWLSAYRYYRQHNIAIPQKIGEKKDDGLMHLIFLGSLTQPKGIYDLLQALGKYKSYLLGKIKLHIGGWEIYKHSSRK